jgi:hypothetical protein
MSHFTLAQLNEIRKFNAASLLCNNIDVTTIPSNPFLSTNNNPTINCSGLPTINWALFGV